MWGLDIRKPIVTLSVLPAAKPVRNGHSAGVLVSPTPTAGASGLKGLGSYKQ